MIGLDTIDRAAPSLLNENVMFYSLTNWDEDFSPSCIWRATAEGDYPDKQWTEDKDPVVCVNGEDMEDSAAPYAIDPSAFYDADGYPWLVFGSHFSGIHLVELDPDDTGKMYDSDGFYYIDNEDLFTKIAKGEDMDEAEDLGVEFTAIEAPYIYYMDGFYYLFVNWGVCCSGVDSTYHIRVGRSENVEGPYYDKDGLDMN